MSAEKISADIKAQLQNEIVETNDDERKVVEKLQIVKFFLENDVFYIGKKEHLTDLIFFLGTKVAKMQKKDPLERDLYMNLFQDLFAKNCKDFVSVKSYRVKFLKAVRNVLRYRLIQKKLKIDFLKMYFTTADELLQKRKEMLDFCLDVLELLILNSSVRHFKTETLDLIFERFKSTLLEGDLAANQRKLESKKLLSKLLVWGKNFELDILGETGSRDESWYRNSLAGSESWRQNLSKVVQSIMFGSLVAAQLEERDKNEYVEIELISALSDVVNLDSSESEKIEELYGSWLWECSLISNELVNPRAAVEALIERILTDGNLDVDTKCQTLYCLLVALYKSYEASVWKGDFEPHFMLRASFKKIVAFVEFSDIRNSEAKDGNQDEEDDTEFLNQVKLDLLTVVMLLDGHAVSKFILPPTTVALKTNNPDFILASLRHYITVQKLTKYFRSYFVQSVKFVSANINEQIFAKIVTFLNAFCDSLDLEISSDLVLIVLDTFPITGRDVNVKNVNIILQLSKIFLGLVKEESLSLVDQYTDKLHEIVEKISAIEFKSQLMEYMIPLLNHLYMICAMMKPSDLAIKVTEMMKAADNFTTLLGKETDKSLFEEFSTLASESSKKERKRKTNDLVKQVLTSDWSSQVELFLKHPQVYSNSKIQNLIVKSLDEMKNDCLVQKNSEKVLNLLNFCSLDGYSFSLILANGQANEKLASTVLRLFNMNRKTPVSEMEPIAELIFTIVKEKPKKLNQAFGKALNGILASEETEMCGSISRLLTFLINGLKKCESRSSEIEAYRIGVSLILLKMSKFEALERSNWMPKKCEKFISKNSEGFNFDEKTEVNVDILALTYKLTMLKGEKFEGSVFLQICRKLASNTEITFVHQQLLSLLFDQNFQRQDCTESLNTEKVLEIFASLAQHVSCRGLINQLASKVPKEELSRLVDLCFTKFAKESSITETKNSLNGKESRKILQDNNGERLASLLQILISKFGRRFGKEFYWRMSTKFYAVCDFVSGEAKILWLNCLLATARQSNFVLIPPQVRLIMLTLGKPTKNPTLDEAILDCEMVLMHNFLSEMNTKDITVQLFSITLCRLLKTLFSLSATALKSLPKANRKRKHDELKEILDQEFKQEAEPIPKDDDQDQNSQNPGVFIYDNNQLTSDQLEKLIAKFRKIVHSLKLLPDQGKWVHAQLISACLVCYRHLSLKVELQKNFSELMQCMVDSVKIFGQFKLVLNSADDFDLAVLNQFQFK